MGIYGDLLSVRRGGQSRFYHYDGLGSTVQLTDASQSVTDTYVYQAFGEEKASSGTTVNPYRYVGQLGNQTNHESGLDYLRARYYTPFHARFLSTDPTGFGGGDENLYRYAGNNPLLNVDPSGLFCEEKPCEGAELDEYGCRAPCKPKSDPKNEIFYRIQTLATKEMEKCFDKETAKLLGNVFACIAKAESDLDACCRAGKKDKPKNYGLLQIDKERWLLCGNTKECGWKICDEKDFSCHVAAARRMMVSLCQLEGVKNLCDALGSYWGVVQGQNQRRFFVCIESFKIIDEKKLKSIQCPKEKPGCSGCGGKLHVRTYTCP